LVICRELCETTIAPNRCTTDVYNQPDAEQFRVHHPSECAAETPLQREVVVISRIRNGRAALAVVVALATLCTLLARTDVVRAQAGKRLALVGGMLLTGYDVPPFTTRSF
jgi:hypothetical protein